MATDKSVSGFNRKCGRTPLHAGKGPVIDKSHVFEMITYNLTISQVIMFLHQTVVDRFKFNIDGWLEFNRLKVRQL